MDFLGGGLSSQVVADFQWVFDAASDKLLWRPVKFMFSPYSSCVVSLCCVTSNLLLNLPRCGMAKIWNQ